ncbi:FAD-dependent catabolic D-arginine dehydrogenase DauA [Pseudooceanicola algae]|uniref:FAD-dependent catabolic D-arginine dehydrogenase DauA n=1 Tax=Pseudooceanicola algae TaxID=1537215 RepID=A0A418SB14_9RHOB|nr:FAD-dependent catabolic D-arginine dehydrogenase DauA [Pseudooceanicola algae]
MASALSADANVAVLERETLPGYHATGRSAAISLMCIGPARIRALTLASQDFLAAPHALIDEAPLLSPRGMILMARDDQCETLLARTRDIAAAGIVVPINAEEIALRMPLVRSGYAALGMYEADARDIDIMALQNLHRRKLAGDGASLLCDTEVLSMRRLGGTWQVETSTGWYAAPVVINASGAWAEQVGSLAGARDLGLQPCRRTGLFFNLPPGVDPATLPMMVDAEGEFYVKPENGGMMATPADLTPSPPCDARPEPMDVALGTDRVRAAFDLPGITPVRSWAGLRSFVADGVPVCGFDPQVEGFFWLVGQGGVGIQCSPALAGLAASMIRGEAPEMPGIDPAWFSPSRPGVTDPALREPDIVTTMTDMQKTPKARASPQRPAD